MSIVANIMKSFQSRSLTMSGVTFDKTKSSSRVSAETSKS